jgi:hypothetical protein
MKTLIGNENKRVIHFGKRHRVAVTFTRVGQLWHAHAALMPKPHKNIRVARQMVARRLANLGSQSDSAA